MAGVGSGLRLEHGESTEYESSVGEGVVARASDVESGTMPSEGSTGDCS